MQLQQVYAMTNPLIALIMKDLLVFIIIVILFSTHKSIRLVVAQKEREYCVKPTYQNATGTEITNCSNNVIWTDILSNHLSYFTSYTKLYFIPGIYQLDQHLEINDVENFSISGYYEKFTIQCPTNTSNGSLSISNSLFVELKNVKLKNCEMSIQNIQLSPNNSLLSGNISAALFLFNVISLNITNISIENCYCHGIVGLNTFGTLRSISIIYTSKKNLGNQTIAFGGFVLVYCDIPPNHIYKIMQEVLIDSCEIFNIQNTVIPNKSKISGDLLYTSVIGIAFYQQTFYVKLKLLNVAIKNVSVNTGPVIMIVHKLIINSIHISNSSFSKIVNKKWPIVSVLVEPSEGSISQPFAFLKLSHCEAKFSTAQSMLHVLQGTIVYIKVDITVCYAEFENNEVEDFWKFELLNPTVSIIKSNFMFNRCSGSILQLSNATEVIFSGNKFCSNIVNKSVITCGKAPLMFEEYNEFFNNTANTVISLSQTYIGLYRNATISFLQNEASICPEFQCKSSVIKFKKIEIVRYNCLFQFFSESGNLDEDFMNNNAGNKYFNVTFRGNKNYRSTIFGTQLNSCHWRKQSAFNKLSPGYVYQRVLHFNALNEYIVDNGNVTFCHCEESTANVDCIKDHFGPIYPGQNIPISLKLSDLSNLTSVPLVERTFSLIQFLNKQPRCDLVPLHDPTLVQLISSKWCKAPLYQVTNLNNDTSCYINFGSTDSDNAWYSVFYFIYFKNARPLGFDNYNGSCECIKQLKAAIPSLICDINKESFAYYGYSWIGLSRNKQNILYVEVCHTYCHNNPTKLTRVQLEFADVQCKYNRTGIICGQCSPGLDAVFGSFNCRKCSNYWLLLIPVFMLAGILLVLSLFVLNMTVVDGKINGFILYTNLVAGNSYSVLPSNVFVVLISLFNLDLGIETCFYNGMTEYAKTWLQFAFPTYLLSIVAVLTIASRYSSSVEKLTRRRVIPVIATIFLLVYNKLMLVTAKVLCSYTTVYNLSNNEHSLIWIWDSSVPIIGGKFLILLTVCLLIFFIIILPFNLLLLFTKFSYRFKIVAEYLKPFLDAYQAPLKSHCHYYLGIELLLRPVAFAVGNRILDPYRTIAIAAFLCINFLLYICTIKPFKSKANTILYGSYMFNTTCMILLVLYFYTVRSSATYQILSNGLILFAIIQFIGTVFYYLCINHLHKIKQLKKVYEKTSKYSLRCWNKYHNKRKTTPDPLPLENYEQLQEELLIIDPDH